MKRKQDSQLKNFCFTFNNYSVATEALLRDFLVENCKYAVYGHEVAPTTGTPHLQGFFSLKKQSRITTIQKALSAIGIKMAIIKANGTAKQNRDYCLKADAEQYFEHGDISITGQGARSDLASVVETIKVGATIEELVEKHPEEMIKYTKGITFIKSVIEKGLVPKERDITVTVYYGQGGTGKTQHAHNDARRLGIELFILSPPSGQSLYFGSYTNELGLLLDDFYGWIKPHDLYRILDRYKYEANIKHGQVWARWLYVWITSNVDPSTFYKKSVMDSLDSIAYNRRFHNIYRLEYYDDTRAAVRTPIAEKEEKLLIFPPK